MSHRDINFLAFKWFTIPAQEKNIIISILTFQIGISHILVLTHLHDSKRSLNYELLHFTCR